MSAAGSSRGAALLFFFPILFLLAQPPSPAAALGAAPESRSKQQPPRMSPAERRARQAKDRRWLAFELVGTRGRIGLTLAPGLIKTHYPGAEGWASNHLTLMVAFHGAVLLGRTELGLELAPVPFGVNIFAGHYFRLHDRPGSSVRIFWPLRGGVGITGVEPVHLQLRADLVGVAFQVGHLLFELSLPSLRYHTEFDPAHHHLSWLFGATFSYVF